MPLWEGKTLETVTSLLTLVSDVLRADARMRDNILSSASAVSSSRHSKSSSVVQATASLMDILSGKVRWCRFQLKNTPRIC